MLKKAIFSIVLGATLAPLTQAEAAPKPATITAKATYKNKLLSYTGKTKGLLAGSQISVIDTETGILLHSSLTNSKNEFKYSLPLSAAPCSVRIEAADVNSVVKVTGAPAASCKAVPVCVIDKPNQKLKLGEPLTLAAVSKNKSAPASQFTWDMGDGDAEATGNSITHTYTHAGLYRVVLNGSAGTGLCADDTLISVAPANANPNPPVAQSGATPDKAAGMPGVGGPNDTDAYVVFPFEDTGMQGGSQVTLPYNSLTPYNALNAQVIQKVAHKPKILGDEALDLFYSAASNPNDPTGAGSINSTSQNLFSSGKPGVNYDVATSTCDNNCIANKTVTKLIDGQDFADAAIAKSEFWDRNYQAYTTDNIQRGQNIFNRHNTVIKNGANLAALPDQGLRGHVDNGQGVRAMPGISDPYKANVPQKLDYSADQVSFVAQNIPASSVDDQGRVNPYPLMRVEAKVDGSRVAATDAVYTSASETRCRECHDQGQIGAEDVWRTPVHETELRNADGSPGPATGEGSFQRSSTPAIIPADKANTLEGFKEYGYAAAIHNRFDEKHVEYNLFGGTETFSSVGSGVKLEFDANGVRKDRVSESRWLKPDGSTSPTNPGNDPTWKMQIKLKFKSAKDYGDETDWRMQEKAALFNTELLHDYMTKYYGQYSGLGNKNLTDLKNVGVTDPAKKTRQFSTGYATTFADGGEEKNSALGAQCAGHHTSQVKADFGAGAQSYQGSLSNYSMTMHAFHGKMQVYKDGANKGKLIRDDRGHPKMWGGRGWDSMYFDDNNTRQRAAGTVVVDTTDPNEGTPLNDPSADKLKDPTLAGTKGEPRNLWDTKKNNWSPEVFGKDPQGELLYKFGDDVSMEENCAKCHTGRTEKSYRDIHHAAGLKCDNCHSDMLAVGNGYRNEKYDYNLTAAGALGTVEFTYTVKDKDGKDVEMIGYKDDPSKLSTADTRRPWIDEPDCGSCHIGDVNVKEGDNVGHGAHIHPLKNVFSAGALKQAWMDGDQSGASAFPMDARFAVIPHKETRPEKATATDADVTAGLAAKKGDTIYVRKELSQSLYRKSEDVHGNLNCSTCHGASHAIWPNRDPNANDNQTAKQLQGYDGNIVECSTCHIKDDFKTGLVATNGGTSGLGVAQGVRDGTVVTPASAKAYLAGPHGMHPVADEYWWKQAENAEPSAKPKKINGGWHNDMAKRPGPDGEDQCAACHGADHKGARLSKTLVDRVFTNEKGKPVKVAKGQVIGCGLCHSIKTSFNGSPKPYHPKKEPTGGWPPAKHHAPPAPESITPGVVGGGGHG